MFLMVIFSILFFIAILLAVPYLVYKKLNIAYETDLNVKRYRRKYKNNRGRK